MNSCIFSAGYPADKGQERQVQQFHHLEAVQKSGWATKPEYSGSASGLGAPSTVLPIAATLACSLFRQFKYLSFIFWNILDNNWHLTLFYSAICAKIQTPNLYWTYWPCPISPDTQDGSNSRPMTARTKTRGIDNSYPAPSKSSIQIKIRREAHDQRAQVVFLMVAESLIPLLVAGVVLLVVMLGIGLAYYSLRRESPTPVEPIEQHSLRDLTLIELKALRPAIRADADFVTDASEFCVICLDEYSEDSQLAILRCSHHFHSLCILSWLKKDPHCPNCRAQCHNKRVQTLTPLQEGQLTRL